jgi:nucleoside-diphosphate-sugar epimerase
MKILITGGNGVIGRFLYNKLKDHDVYTPKRLSVDFTSREHVDQFFNSHDRFDIVLHCAVRGGNRLHHDNWDVLDDNLKMYYNILHHKSSYSKFITFGSGAEVYMPDSPYGLSKKAISKSMLDQFNFYNIRIFGLFGEGELESRFIKANLDRYFQYKPIEIYQNKMMDFFYIEDLWKIVQYYMTTEFPPKEIDCCYKESRNTDLKDIAGIINTLDNHKVDIKIKSIEPGQSYTGKSSHLDLEYIGLEKGLKLEYEKYKLCN